MARIVTEEEYRASYDDLFSHISSDVLLEIEQEVFGTDYGATSWSTIDQIDSFVSELDLKRGDRLLDIGSGSGWPALFMAEHTGCDAVLSDLPMTGLVEARKRAEKDGLGVVIVNADGASLPLANAGFDAVSHSDVLCCLTQKAEVIGECHRVLRPGGTLVFSVLELSESFGAKDNQDQDFGPEFASADRSYEEMLAAAGFQTEIHDWTEESRETAQKRLAARKSRFDRLAAELGVEEATDSVLRSERGLAAIDRGDLVRRFYVCHA